MSAPAMTGMRPSATRKGIKAARDGLAIRHERIPASMLCISDAQHTLQRGVCSHSFGVRLKNHFTKVVAVYA